MAAIVANTGSNNWNTNGAWVGGVQPTAADDVTIPATAVVTIPAATTVACRSCAISASGTLVFAIVTTSILNIGDATAGAGNVAFSNAGTITLTGLGQINFISTSATVQTITSGGQTMPPWNINSSSNGSYQLADNNTIGSTSTVILTKGTLDTNGKTCSWGAFQSANANVRTLTLGASAITITGGGTVWNCATITNLSVTTNTATVTCNAAAVTFNGAANWNGLSLVMSGSGLANVTGAGTFANLTRTGTAVKTDGLQTSGAGPTITGTLTLTGNSTINRLIIQSSGAGITSTITAAAVSLTNVDFIDINAAGAVIPWTGTSLGNCLGNSNITFNTPATQTRTGAGGNWSTAGNWTSRVPLPQDNVVVSSGASGTLTEDMPRVGANVDFTGFAGTLAMSTTHTLFGNWTLASGMAISGISGTVLGGRSTQTITTSGLTTNNVTVAAPGGSYTLQDALTFSGRLTVSQGTFTSSNFNMSGTSSAATYVFSGTAVVNLGTTTWTTLGTAANPISSLIPAANFSAASSTLVIGSTLASSRSLIFTTLSVLGTLTYTVAGSTGALIPNNSSMTIGTLNFSDASNARTLTLTSTSTLTILNAFNVNGTSGNLTTINSTIGGSAATLSKASGIVSCDYLSIQDSTATGGASWYAGANSTSVSNNTGWIFTAAPVTSSGGGMLLMGVG